LALGEVRATAEERVLETATRIFAELGYDAATFDMIKAAAGLDAEGSPLLQGGKQGLYRAVLARLHGQETAQLEAAFHESARDAQGIHRLVDASVDFLLAHPEFLALWEHRGLKDARDLRFPEEEFRPPLLALLTRHSWQGVRPDADLDFLAWMVMWAVRGFMHTSSLEWSSPDWFEQHPSQDAAATRRFRAELHKMVAGYL
jgi:AcrR family transcriptional regulator